MSPHSELVADVLVAITALPQTFAWKAHNFVGVTASRHVMRANFEGCADIIGCSRGRFFAFDAKTGRGILQKKQRAFERLVVSTGGIFAVVRSIEDAVAALA